MLLTCTKTLAVNCSSWTNMGSCEYILDDPQGNFFSPKTQVRLIIYSLLISMPPKSWNLALDPLIVACWIISESLTCLKVIMYLSACVKAIGEKQNI